jgi:outer membrane protein assembly factor BamB
MHTLTLLVGWLILAAVAETKHWPQFRGPNGDGTSAATGLPQEWSESKNVRWKTAIHDKGWSSPVVWGDQIWLTTAKEDGHELFALCIDRASGKIIHDIKLRDVAEPQYCHPTNSFASSTPAIEAGRVYLHFGVHGTFCLDAGTGSTLWSRTDLECNHHRGAGSSPVLFENLLIVPFDGFDVQYVVALDTRTGKTVWKRDRNIDYGTNNGDAKKAYGTCALVQVNGRPLVVSPSSGATIAYDARTGEEVWRVRSGGMNVSARPLIGKDRLYVHSGEGGFRLFALRPDGEGDITTSHVDWKYNKVVPARPSQLLIGDLIFMVNDAGIVSCVDAKVGEQVWQHRLGGTFTASPIFADGRIYLSNDAGLTTVIEPAREFKLLTENQLDDGCMASPAVTGRSIILRTRTHLYCLEVENR